MKQLLTKLLCALFIHRFSTVSGDKYTATVICEREHCDGIWHVDRTKHTMERMQGGEI